MLPPNNRSRAWSGFRRNLISSLPRASLRKRSMSKSRRWLRRIAVAALLASASFLAVRQWLVLPLIVNLIRQSYSGRVVVKSWWLNLSSSGLVGIELREGEDTSSGVWASIENISTDVSLKRLARGAFRPSTVTIDRPKVALELDREGGLETKIPFRSSASSSTTKLPRLIVDRGEIALHQEGRPAIEIKGIHADAKPDQKGSLALSAKIQDPRWGVSSITGSCAQSFKFGNIVLSCIDLPSNPRLAHGLPYIPPIVWEGATPTGPLDLKMELGWGSEDASKTAKSDDLRLLVETDFKRTHLDIGLLGFSLDEVEGTLVYKDKVVRLEKTRGRAFDGKVGADGLMSFETPESRFSLLVDLEDVDSRLLPKIWRTQNFGLTGLLDAKAELKLRLGEGLVDLGGTKAQGVVHQVDFQDVPLRLVRFAIATDGTEPDQIRPDRFAPFTNLDLAEIEKHEKTTHIEKKAYDPKDLYFKIPEALAGKLSLGIADIVLSLDPSMAKVPTPKGHDVRNLKFKGRLAVDQGSFEDVHLGSAAAHFSFDRGVAEAVHFAAKFIDPPGSGPRPPPRLVAEEIPTRGELPENSIRGGVRVDLLDGDGISARLETKNAPIGDLVSRFAPTPLPIAGRVTSEFNASAPLSSIHDLSTWQLKGSASSPRFIVKNTELTPVSASVRIQQKRVFIDSISGKIGEEPLSGSGEMSLEAPYALRASLSSGRWKIADLLELAGVSNHLRANGTLSIRGAVKGALDPLALDTQGEGSVSGFEFGAEKPGDVRFSWKSENGELVFLANDAKVFGGEARLQIQAPANLASEGEKRFIEKASALASFKAIDLARVAKCFLQDSVETSGLASGSLRIDAFHLGDLDSTTARASAKLTGAGIHIDRIDTNNVIIAADLKNRVASYSLSAESLGGTIVVKGRYPLANGSAVGGPKPIVGELKVAAQGLIAWGAREGFLDGPLRHAISRDWRL